MKERLEEGLPADWLDRCEDILVRFSLLAAYRKAANDGCRFRKSSADSIIPRKNG